MITVSCVSTNSRTIASPLSTQPVIGVAAEYASNPELFATNTRSETHAALLADMPVNYDVDALHLSLIPRVRYGGATGYSAVTSNYYHLDAGAQVANELGSLSFTGALYRDSSLLYAGELANGIGVRRDTSSEDVNWQRSLTERAQIQLDVSTARTLYAQNAGSTNLVDYRYSSVSPSFAYSVSERDTLRVLGGASRYNSLNHLTSSDSVNLQLGFDRRLSELWTLASAAGYSKSTDHYRYFLGNIDSTQKGALYSVSLTRQAEVLGVTATASRALTPTGFAFLSRQDNVKALVNYNSSERWAFSAGLTWANISDPLITGGSIQRRFYSGDLSAVWHWTEQWLLTLRVTKIGQKIQQPSISATSNGVSLEISRQFYRTNQ
jgi:hypothetical protein